MDYAHDLMTLLAKEKQLDFLLPPEKREQRLSTDFLFGPARGKMFGVLVCLDGQGDETTLKAFSGQYNTLWQVDGWVPPLFNLVAFEQLNTPEEKKIKNIGRQIDLLPDSSKKRHTLRIERKKCSQQLMKNIHRLYRLRNFHGDQLPLTEIFYGNGGIPSGTGDCCAPKLLNFAACHKLHPISLVEFYWGKENLSGSKKHGHFYPPCDNKCAPILGHMLCGLRSNDEQK